MQKLLERLNSFFPSCLTCRRLGVSLANHTSIAELIKDITSKSETNHLYVQKLKKYFCLLSA